MQVRNPADSAKKFVARAGAAQPDYASGEDGAGGRWQAGAEASEEAFGAGVTAAVNERRFSAGVRNAEGAYAQAVAPFTAALASTTLSVRGMRGSPQNARRVQEVSDLMRKTRRERLGLSA